MSVLPLPANLETPLSATGYGDASRKPCGSSDAERFKDGVDYVFIGRQMARDRKFGAIMGDIDQALEHLNNGQSNHTFTRRMKK